LSDEANLLERVRQCEMAALAEVYDDYYDRIYRYVYGYLGRSHAAEDLTASVFLRLLRAVRNGRSPRSNLSAWLYRVAHNLVVDTFRRGPPQELELAEWLESDEPDPAYTAEVRSRLALVRAAIMELTELQQQVIALKFFHGMDTREVSAILGKSEGAIDALQHRALLALRKSMPQTPSGTDAARAGPAGAEPVAVDPPGEGSDLRLAQVFVRLSALRAMLERSLAAPVSRRTLGVVRVKTCPAA